MTKNTHILIGGHKFNRVIGICDGCGTPKKQYDDAAKKPLCPTSDGEKRERFPIDE